VSSDALRLGRSGENDAVELLKKNGYKIIARNYRTALGELDIVASDKDTFCFIEVKARSSCKKGAAAEAVSGAKQRQVSKAALQFIKDRDLWGKRARFDVVTVIYDGPTPRIELIKNAFELDAHFSI